MLFYVHARQRGERGLTPVGLVVITPLSESGSVATFLRSGRVEQLDAWLVRGGLDLVGGIAAPLGDCTEVVVQSASADEPDLFPALGGRTDGDGAPSYNGWRSWLSRAWPSSRRAVRSGDVAGRGPG